MTEFNDRVNKALKTLKEYHDVKLSTVKLMVYYKIAIKTYGGDVFVRKLVEWKEKTKAVKADFTKVQQFWADADKE